MHVQYDAFILVLIFGIGLLLGWLRWASGSALLTIILHNRAPRDPEPRSHAASARLAGV